MRNGWRRKLDAHGQREVHTAIGIAGTQHFDQTGLTASPNSLSVNVGSTSVYFAPKYKSSMPDEVVPA